MTHSEIVAATAALVADARKTNTPAAWAEVNAQIGRMAGELEQTARQSAQQSGPRQIVPVLELPEVIKDKKGNARKDSNGKVIERTHAKIRFDGIGWFKKPTSINVEDVERLMAFLASPAGKAATVALIATGKAAMAPKQAPKPAAKPAPVQAPVIAPDEIDTEHEFTPAELAA